MFSCICQLKALEVDLEEERQERQKVIQEKRELERQIKAVAERTPSRNIGKSLLCLENYKEDIIWFLMVLILTSRFNY